MAWPFAVRFREEMVPAQIHLSRSHRSRILNTSYNSGTGSFLSWEKHLLNTFEVTSLLVERMASDYEKAGAKLRKPYAAPQIEALLR